MISLRSFLLLGIIGGAHGAEESGDVTIPRFWCSAMARDSAGDSVSKAFRGEDICSSIKFRSSRDSASGTLAPSAGESGYDRFSRVSPGRISRIAVLPFTDSPGETIASSSIWNIRSLADCLALSMGLVTELAGFLGTLFLLLRTEGDVLAFSLVGGRGRTSYDSTWLSRDCSAIASIRRRLSLSTELAISGYLSKTYSSELRPRETG